VYCKYLRQLQKNLNENWIDDDLSGGCRGCRVTFIFVKVIPEIKRKDMLPVPRNLPASLEIELAEYILFSRKPGTFSAEKELEAPYLNGLCHKIFFLSLFYVRLTYIVPDSKTKTCSEHGFKFAEISKFFSSSCAFEHLSFLLPQEALTDGWCRPRVYCINLPKTFQRHYKNTLLL
jgi:hypothetical protein